jgi:excisionase family DNA binding protein
VSDLASLFAPDLVDAIERFVDERVRLALTERNGTDPDSPWLRISEAAERLRISERQLHRLLVRGRVRSVHVGRRRLLHRDDLDELVRRGETPRR